VEDIILQGISSVDTVLDAQASTRHIIVPTAVRMQITNISLVNGLVSDNTVAEDGGSIWMNTGASLTMNSSILSGNIANEGGVFFGGTKVLNDVVIRNNTANDGGVFGQGTNTLINSELFNNVAVNGGVFSEGLIH